MSVEKETVSTVRAAQDAVAVKPLTQPAAESLSTSGIF